MEQLYKRFRFEMSEGDYNQSEYRTCDVSCHFPDDVTWIEVLSHFAHFLEGCGYVGVVNEIYEMLDGNAVCEATQEQ